MFDQIITEAFQKKMEKSLNVELRKLDKKCWKDENGNPVRWVSINRATLNNLK